MLALLTLASFDNLTPGGQRETRGMTCSTDFSHNVGEIGYVQRYYLLYTVLGHTPGHFGTLLRRHFIVVLRGTLGLADTKNGASPYYLQWPTLLKCMQSALVPAGKWHSREPRRIGNGTGGSPLSGILCSCERHMDLISHSLNWFAA